MLLHRSVLFSFVVFYCFVSCKENSGGASVYEEKINSIVEDTFDNENEVLPAEVVVSELEQSLLSAGLVDVLNVIPEAQVDLKYSTSDNFMGIDLYGSLTRCYLQPDVADKLAVAHNYLQTRDSTLTFLIYDGVRPRCIQQAMWDTLDMPVEEKVKYVSNPKHGSLHNFGAAIDLTLAYKENGEALDMGTPYDFFGIEAYPIKEPLMLEKNRITQEAVDNRKLLRRCMMKGGFFNIQTEWWHFNSCNREEAKQLYQIVE